MCACVCNRCSPVDGDGESTSLCLLLWMERCRQTPLSVVVTPQLQQFLSLFPSVFKNFALWQTGCAGKVQNNSYLQQSCFPQIPLCSFGKLWGFWLVSREGQKYTLKKKKSLYGKCNHKGIKSYNMLL